jgi:23S rRNA-/tRNA-specific pseudouridylate synthase
MSDFSWIPFAPKVRVLNAHPAGLLAVEKPEGVLAHPNQDDKGKDEVALISGNYSFEEEAFHVRDGQGGIKRVYLLNRLDSPTSGILLLSLDAALAEAVKELFAKAKVSKKYIALVKGRGLKSPRGTWQDVLIKSKGPGGGVRSSKSTGAGAPAISLYQWERAANGELPLSLLKLEPRTGRTHQLRVQSAMHGHPILGDRTYGDFDFNKSMGTVRGFKRLFLHSHSTDLELDWRGEKLSFKAVSPIPQEFIDALGGPDGGNAAALKKPKPAGTQVSPRLRIRL